MDPSLPPILHGLQMGLLGGSAILLLAALTGVFVRIYLGWNFPTLGELASSKRPAGPLREKRRMPRVKSDAVLELVGADGRSGRACRLLNISVSGACVASKQILKEGEKIEGWLHSSREGRLHVSGEVVWTKPLVHSLLCGVHFESITRPRS